MNSEKFPICNINIELTLQIEPILNHPVVKQLFEKLQKNKIIKKETSHQDWVKMIVEDYKNKARKTKEHQDFVKSIEDRKRIAKDLGREDIGRKYFDELDTEPNAIEEVKFRIKDNFLFTNDEIDFGDLIYYEVFIPYQLQKITEKFELDKGRELCVCSGGLDDSAKCIHNGIKLRVLIANGIIKLQIGEFSLKTSPDIISNLKISPIYQNYATITSFPLLYFPSIIYQIPKSRLQTSLYATDSFIKEKDYDKQFSDIWKVKKEINDLFLISKFFINGRWSKEHDGKLFINNMTADKDGKLLFDETTKDEEVLSIFKDFQQKAKEWLEREGFEGYKSNNDFSDEDSIFCCNKYIAVKIRNENFRKENFGDKWLADYYGLY